MAETTAPLPPGGFKPRFALRVLGTPAPVFPGFEVDICERVSDGEKPDALWHRERARGMLRAHPEIKSLIGHTPSTAVWCVFFAGLQLGLAAWAGGASWWMVLAVAWLVGAWVNINLFMLAHECQHGLVFGRSKPDRWLYTLTSLPMFMSGHHAWWVEHAVHHNDLGAKKDFITRRRSIFLAARYTPPLIMPYSLVMLVTQVLRSAIGLAVYFCTSILRGTTEPTRLAVAILADVHLVSGYRRYRLNRWAVAYPALSLMMTAAMWLVFGWKSVLYLLAAEAFMTGFLHPVMFGMILSNSHFHGHRRYQPSSSYYGWFNRLTFNFGMHTEHHDLAGIPWSRLPKLRQIAPEHYDGLVETKSYTALAFQFVVGRRGTFEAQFDNEAHRNAAAWQPPPSTAEVKAA